MTIKILIEVFGWLGAVAIVAAYALVSFGLLTPDSVWYQMLNLTGAVGIVIVSLTRKAYPPAALNAVWTLIAAVALLKIVF